MPICQARAHLLRVLFDEGDARFVTGSFFFMGILFCYGKDILTGGRESYLRP